MFFNKLILLFELKRKSAITNYPYNTGAYLESYCKYYNY